MLTEVEPPAQAVPSTQRPGLVTGTVAVLGAGSPLGFPMARNLARAGLVVRAWHRSPGQASPLAQDGAYVARSPQDAVAGASVVITMLADEAAVIAAMDGPGGALSAMSARPAPVTRPAGPSAAPSASAAAGPGPALWVQMSTIGEAGTRRCADLARASGVGFVDAPVLGTRRPAEEGKLVVLASGPEAARTRLAPVFAAIGQHTIHAGEVGAGSRLKLVASSWVMAVAEAAAETIGRDEPDGAHDTGLLGLALAAKDASRVRGAAAEHGLNLPLLDAIARRYTET